MIAAILIIIMAEFGQAMSRKSEDDNEDDPLVLPKHVYPDFCL